MNYEEKYKEALDLMKDCVPDENGLVHVHPEDIFPELRESEDDRIRKGIIRNLEYLADRAEGFVKDELKERISWLEKQGETFTKKDVDNAYIEGMAFAKNELEKQKPAWSEEDENILQGIWDEILANKHNAKEYEWKTYDKFLAWLESLKARYTWKPSNEQIEAIRLARAFVTDDFSATQSLSEKLIELEEQLKKL